MELDGDLSDTCDGSNCGGVTIIDNNIRNQLVVNRECGFSVLRNWKRILLH